MTTDLLSYLRRYRPGLSREEAAVVAGISSATLTRRIKAGFTADEAITAAKGVGGSPVEALVLLGFLDAADVERFASQERDLSSLGDRELLEELLDRAYEEELTEEYDRAEAGMRRMTPRRFVPSEAAATVHEFPARAGAGGDNVPEPFIIAAMEDLPGEDMRAEMEGYQEFP